MNTLKTIYDKIGKTDLAKHEVQLGSIQDLQKRVEEFIVENNKVNQLTKSLDSIKLQFKQLDKKIASDFKLLRDDSEKLFKQASDLGIETKTPFQLQAKISKVYGENWDIDAINFLRK